MLRRAVDHVRSWGPLAWIGLAWLAGPLPGFDEVGATGQPTGAVWWWHVAAGVLLLWRLMDVARRAARGEAVAAPDPWRRGRRWLTVVVVGWLALAVIAASQALDGMAGWGHALTFVSAAAVAALAPSRSVGGEAVSRLAAGGLVVAALTLVTFAGAADLLAGEFGFYTVKAALVLPGAAHNVVASLLLVAAPAIAVASQRGAWWRWALPLAGVALGATLSRAALVAALVGVVAAALVAHDRSLARRLAVVLGLAVAVTGWVLVTYGAAVPGDGTEPTSVASRVDLWDSAIEAFARAPSAGVGLDGLVESSASDHVVPHEHAHNLALHALATTGMPGLLATAAVWLGLLVGAATQLDRDRRALLLVAVLSLAAHAQVDELAFRPVVEGLLALLVVAAAAPRDPEQRVFADQR